MKYTNNEAYFDVIEEIDAIIDKSGTTVIAEIQGYVSIYDIIFVAHSRKAVSFNSLFGGDDSGVCVCGLFT